jgi:hypothetical protein
MQVMHMGQSLCPGPAGPPSSSRMSERLSRLNAIHHDCDITLSPDSSATSSFKLLVLILSLSYRFDRNGCQDHNYRQVSDISRRTAYHHNQFCTYIGASGLLGTAIRKAFAQTSDGQYEVLSLALSRSHEFGLVPLDLTKEDEVERVFRQFRPNCEFDYGRCVVNVIITLTYIRGNTLCCRKTSRCCRKSAVLSFRVNPRVS